MHLIPEILIVHFPIKYYEMYFSYVIIISSPPKNNPCDIFSTLFLQPDSSCRHIKKRLFVRKAFLNSAPRRAASSLSQSIDIPRTVSIYSFSRAFPNFFRMRRICSVMMGASASPSYPRTSSHNTVSLFCSGRQFHSSPPFPSNSLWSTSPRRLPAQA